MKSSWFAPQSEVFNKVQEAFSMPLKDRLAIWAEVDKYRWKEDESVWRQKKGLSPTSYEVSFDGEFVCFFDTSETLDKAYVNVLEGIRKLYSEGKIFFNKELYAVREAELTAQKTVEMDAPTTPEDKIITEVVKKQANRSGKKVKLKERITDV